MALHMREQLIRAVLAHAHGDIEIDYLAIVDSETFEEPLEETENYIIIIAAYIENIRLIDNIEFKLERV